MEHQRLLIEQLRLACGVQRRRNMPLLMRQLHKRQRAGSANAVAALTPARKHGIYETLDRAGLGGNADGGNLWSNQPCRKVRPASPAGPPCGGKGSHSGADRADPLSRAKTFLQSQNNLSGVCVKHCQRGCVIAGVDAQRQHLGSSVSPHSRATAPKRPLTNW